MSVEDRMLGHAGEHVGKSDARKVCYGECNKILRPFISRPEQAMLLHLNGNGPIQISPPDHPPTPAPSSNAILPCSYFTFIPVIAVIGPLDYAALRPVQRRRWRRKVQRITGPAAIRLTYSRCSSVVQQWRLNQDQRIAGPAATRLTDSSSSSSSVQSLRVPT